MSELGQRRRLRATGDRGVRMGAPRRPNVLSGEAVPNRLSVEAGRAAPGATRPRSLSTFEPVSGQSRLRSQGAAQGSADAEPRAFRLPSLPTIIFLIFVGITLFRIVAAFLNGLLGGE
jgi:hypothetical protein